MSWALKRSWRSSTSASCWPASARAQAGGGGSRLMKNTRALGQLGQHGGQRRVDGGLRAQLLGVVEHQRPGRLEQRSQAPEQAAQVGRDVTQVVGGRRRPLPPRPRQLQRHGGEKKVLEGRGVGVAGVELQPDAGRGGGLQVGGDEGRLDDARRPGGPAIQQPGAAAAASISANSRSRSKTRRRRGLRSWPSGGGRKARLVGID